MNPEIVSRIIKLIDQTGDKVVMMDPSSERAIVIMDLADYERMNAGQNSGSVGSRQSVFSEKNPAAGNAPAADAMPPVLNDQPSDAVVETPIEPKGPVAPVADRQELIAAIEDSSEMVEIELPTETQKKPSIYVNPGQKDPLAESAFSDLTQTELLDKINRDIAAWKTAQDRKRTDELRAAASQGQAPASVDALEEEERFYLEPID
jgi:hypothetical protein